MEADSQSVSEARQLIERAHVAWQAYRQFSQAQVDAIVAAMAAVATQNAAHLARLAVEETTYGKVADKIEKNLFASERVFRAIRGMKTVGELRYDGDRGVLELGEPVGVVAAILPCTNPTSTAIYKILIALKAGNAVVLSPHPAAMGCICETVGLMQQAAARQGAPEGLIGCFSQPTRAGTEELMKHKRTRVILATGGMGIVRAAYSSGKPAFGVGPGNVPAYVDRSAHLPEAVANVVRGKSFDWGTICSSEQALVAERELRQPILDELRRQQVYLMNADEAAALARLLINPETFAVNPQCVGQSPQKLAAMAGFGDKVGAGILVLAAELEGMGKQFPLSAEKLSPVLALFFMPDREASWQRCADLLHFGGLGHTCVIHARDDAAIREYGRRMPAFRVVVNNPSPQGSIGALTNLFPAMTLGCGAVGGNITSDNIGPQHLMNIKRVAWPANATLATLSPAANAAPLPPPPAEAAQAACACQHARREAPVGGLQPTHIREAVERALAERGIRPQAESATAPPPTSASTPSPAPEPARPFVIPPLPEKPKPVAFVCEADVRAAVAAGKKIAVGPKTLITPSARDYASAHDAFENV